MNNNRKRSGPSFSSLIGWAILLLALLGGPLSRIVQQISNGAITIPPSLIPIAMGALVVVSILISVLRGLGSSSDSSSAPRLPPASNLPPVYRAPPQRWDERDIQLPRPPQLEPVISPLGVLVGAVGALLLGGVALLLFGTGRP